MLAIITIIRIHTTIITTTTGTTTKTKIPSRLYFSHL
jgi:hypothetical protein